MPRSGKSLSDKSSVAIGTRSISASAVSHIQRSAREQRNASGTQQKYRPKYPGHAYTLNVGAEMARYQAELGGRRHHYDQPARDDYEWEEWHPRAHEINKRTPTRILELDSDYLDTTKALAHQSSKSRTRRFEDDTGYSSSASSSQVSVARRPIASSRLDTPGCAFSTPTSLLELYLDEKVQEHPAQTEREVRVGAIASAYTSPYQSRSSSPTLRPSKVSLKSSNPKKLQRRNSELKSGLLSLQSQNGMVNGPQIMEQEKMSPPKVEPLVLLDSSAFFALIYDLIEEATRSENRENMKQGGVLVAKALVVLYLASCAWNVLTAVRDAMLKAFEPFYCSAEFSGVGDWKITLIFHWSGNHENEGIGI